MLFIVINYKKEILDLINTIETKFNIIIKNYYVSKSPTQKQTLFIKCTKYTLLLPSKNVNCRLAARERRYSGVETHLDDKGATPVLLSDIEENDFEAILNLTADINEAIKDKLISSKCFDMITII